MQALNVMGNTITGAASGKASPKGSQSQAKEQESNESLFVILTSNEIGEHQSLFFGLYIHFLFIYVVR